MQPSIHHHTDAVLLYAVTGADANAYARHRIGRDLSPDEMATVKKCVEWGMSDAWCDVVAAAVDVALEHDSPTAEHP